MSLSSPSQFELSLRHRYQALEYGAQSGSTNLRNALAIFYNSFFHPSRPVLRDEVVCSNGTTALIDLLAYALCDRGDAILFPTPNFYMLDYDVGIRADVRAVPVSCSTVNDQYSSRYAEELCRAFESKLLRLEFQGVCVRAIFLCNPSNPEGRCYSRTTLQNLARFCSKHRLHMIVDEIYAMSQFTPSYKACSTDLDAFTSALEIMEEPEHNVRMENIHVFYGVSKDFGMGGLRLGSLVCRNAPVREAILKAT